MWNLLSDCEIEDWSEVSRAQVYYSIDKLAERGLICPAREVGAETRRARRTWRMTPEGRRALTLALSSKHWAHQRRVPPFLTWVGWSQLARPATRKKTVAERRAFLQDEVARKRETLAGVEHMPAETPTLRVTISMINHLIRQMLLELDWLDELDEVFGT
jgi:DNA-binding PadR family transcriptional regulator